MLHISFAIKRDYSSLDEWLNRIDFYTPILDALQKEVDVFHLDMLSFESHEIRKGVHYYSTKSRLFSRWFPIRLIKLAKSLSPDVILIHGLTFPIQTLLLRWVVGKNVKLWVQHHADRPAHGLKGILQKVTDQSIDRYLFSTDELAVDWIGLKIISSSKKIVEVIGVTAAYQFNSSERQQREHQLSYIWVGRFDSNKDPDTLLSAFISFVKTAPQAKLYLIFSGDDSLEEIKRLVTGFEKNIYLIGAVKRNAMAQWYRKVNFVISTSHYEANGAAVCEAMACGCIPILSEIPSFKMMTQQAQCGLLFKAADPEDLLTALKKSEAINFDEERRKTLSQFQINLSNEAIASKMVKALRSSALPDPAISIV